jgi:hypothetical protein
MYSTLEHSPFSKEAASGAAVEGSVAKTCVKRIQGICRLDRLRSRSKQSRSSLQPGLS